jgi:lipoprotein-releasing system permease protein
MNGFEQEMRLRILNLVPHVTVQSYAGTSDNREMVNYLSEMRTVVRSHRFEEANALFYANEGSRVGRLVFAEAGALGPLSEHLRPKVEDVKSNEIVLGSKLAQALDIKVGESVVALISEKGSERRFSPLSLTLVSTLESNTEIDRVFAFSAASANVYPALASPPAWAITIEDPLKAAEVAQALRRSLGPQYWVSDWTHSLGNLYQAIQLSRQIVGLMLVALLVVAVFNVVTSLVLVTADRRPSSAMLRTMGATPADVLKIFTIQGTIIGVGGATIGAALGAMIALGIPSLVALIESVSGQPLLDTSVYPLAYVPVDLRAVDFISISVTAFVLSLLASVLPAIRTSRSSITESLRQSR